MATCSEWQPSEAANDTPQVPESITYDLTWQVPFPATNRALQDSERDGVAAKRCRRPFKFMRDATKARLQVEAGKSLDACELNEMWIVPFAFVPAPPCFMSLRATFPTEQNPKSYYSTLYGKSPRRSRRGPTLAR